MDQRINIGGAIVFVGLTILVAVKVASAPALAGALRATAEQKAIVAMAIAGEEPGWRKTTEQEFPADLWSQRDAFHGNEASKAKDLAFANRIPVEDVLRAIDEDIHKSRDRDRLAGAIPCKPRPFYD